jgi:hypothetical protein
VKDFLNLEIVIRTLTDDLKTVHESFLHTYMNRKIILCHAGSIVFGPCSQTDSRNTLVINALAHIRRIPIYGYVKLLIFSPNKLEILQEISTFTPFYYRNLLTKSSAAMNLVVASFHHH